MPRKILRREYNDKGDLIKLECGKCGQLKTVDCFHKSKNIKDGFCTTCKKCKQIYFDENKDNILKQQQDYYKENKSIIINKKKKYQEKNKEKLTDYYHNYYTINKDKHIAYFKQYRNTKRDQEIAKIYENFTRNNYPESDIQYGVIYGVLCKPTNKWYIGQTRNGFNTRYSGNFFKHYLSHNLKENIKKQILTNDIEKYGQESFEIFEVIDVAFSERELDEKEAYYIDYYKAYDEGYNTYRGNIFKHGKEKRKYCCE